MIKMREAILQIAKAGIKSVSPYDMIRKRIKLKDNTLTVHAGGPGQISLQLSSYKNIYVIGAGKATAPMARALEEILGSRISGGIIAVKPGHTADLDIINRVEGGHPVPDDGSLEAAKEIVTLTDKAGESDLVINLISGGGSALLTLPYNDGGDFSITLEEMQQTTRELLNCGATIHEINCVRKHLSSIKGGRLSERIHPAESVSIILSDVVGDDLHSIASGLTVPDETTYADALSITRKYDIETLLPGKVMQLLRAGGNGEIPDTPKPGAACFKNCRNILLGTNALALRAAAGKAEDLGYTTLVLTSRITGEAREIAKFYAALAQEAGGVGNGASGSELYKKPVCILAGGETTVTIRGNGKGGRNQEMALAVLAEIAKNPAAYSGTLFASVATDGNDGPTDAAGAFASTEICETSVKKGLDIDEYLGNNDAYTFFSKIDGLIKTGATNTNVCDLQILLAV